MSDTAVSDRSGDHKVLPPGKMDVKRSTDTGGAGKTKGTQTGLSRKEKAKRKQLTVMMKKVCKIYGGEENPVQALTGVSLQLRKGSICAIMGPSGSGKSTLINLVGSLDGPSEGEVIIDSINLENMNSRELTEYRRDKVGFVFQTFNLLPNLTAVENVELPMEFTGVASGERRERARQLLKTVGMEHREEHIPMDLSGGERQRVAIARALANNPQIILADEPTGNLDSDSGEKVIELLKSLARKGNKTLIIVTHDMKVAEMTDRIITLKDGKIKEIIDVGDINVRQALSRELEIPRHLLDKLFSEGYDRRERILKVTEAELLMKNFKKKDKQLIMERIGKFRSEVSGNICHDCNMEIPLKDIGFCPFCGRKL